jgi:hypothetical protein
MNEWRKVTLSKSEVGQHMAAITAEAADAIRRARSRDAAVFSSEAQPHGADVYFSPAVVPLLDPLLARFKSVRCEKPDADAVGLIAGDQTEAWDLLRSS